MLVAAPLFVVPSASAAATSITWSLRASGLQQPTQVTSARDGSKRLFVVEKAGRVLVYSRGEVRSRPFLDIRSRVRNVGEAGLLSIAFHPRYREHPFMWAAYTTNAGNLRVARFRAHSLRSNHVRRSSAKKVLSVPHPDQYTNHFGGQLAFANSGLLFVSTGDGGGGGDPFDHGQSTRTLQGKLLRLKVLGAKKDCGRYACVPAGNPYAGKTRGQGEIWAIGLRNAWRFSVDPTTGALWVGDVGQDAVEEVDRVGRGGLNLGWSCREGDRVYDASRCRPGANYHAPKFTYNHSYGQSITGGFIYRGARWHEQLGGRYVGGDFVSGKIFYSSHGRLVTAGKLANVTSFGENDRHELWAVTYGGGLYRMSVS